ncbi:MAG: aldehyde ferredoxin oxidoreductase N-terminal domain-containing protein [Candidatus Heimdallarchaeaceae archaeon]
MIQPQILEVNLTDKSYELYSDDELFEKYLGGIGVAIELLNRLVPQGTDPLSPENAVVFAIGPLSVYFPVASKTCAVFKSPLTGNLGESYAGGRLSTAMRFANIGALIIRGKSEKPVYMVICEGQVQFVNASPISLMYPNTAARIIRENVGYPGRRSVITIGPAGERQVLFASATVDRMRHFGRLGLGAVFGSKNLKGIAIIGDQPLSLEKNTDYMAYRKFFRAVYKKCTETTLMAKYHVLGTTANVLPLNSLKALPTKNFQLSTFEHAESISGEYFAENLLAKRVACGGCPIGCIHLAILRERWSSSSVGDIHSIAVPYDYEPIYALGSNLGIGNASDLLKLIEAVEREGMDAMTCGVVLGWLAEAYEKNIITPSDTRGIPIRFGYPEDFLKIIPKISRANSNEELYFIASKGVAALVEHYGGHDFGMHIAGLEPAGYATGPFAIMGLAMGGRHSHLDNAGYSLDQKALLDPISVTEGVRKLALEEEWRNVLNSLVICLFARGVYDPETTVKALETLKIYQTIDDLHNLGTEIQKKRLAFKYREGFSVTKVKVKLAERFTSMMTAHGIISKKTFDEMFTAYQKLLNERYFIPWSNNNE